MGELMARNLQVNPRYDEPYWEGTQWYKSFDFHIPQETDTIQEIDQRATWFYEAVAATKGMVNPTPGAGQVYMTTKRDANGDMLRADRNYKLHVPADVPVGQFWSVTLYSENTRRPYDNGGTEISDVSLGSRTEGLKQNNDGSVDIYIGPDAPEGMESNHLKTVGDDGWFVYFRLYAPEQPFFDKSFKLADFEMIETRAETRSTTDVSAASPTETPAESAGVDAFLIARGGPYYDLQQRMGLLHERALNAGRRAAVLVAIAWGVPLLLSAVAGQAIGPLENRPFLLELGAWARFFIAIGIFVLMERLVEERLRMHLRQFVRAPLLAPGATSGAAEAVAQALYRRDAWPAELVCAVAAYAITLSGAAIVLGAESSSWLVTVSPEGAALTPAGWWCALVSGPLFWFLLLRWLWRHAVWGLLLRDLAHLELRLVATHPDGAGGLAFIGQYPNAFAAFVFALSCVLGAAIAQHLLQGVMSAATYGQLMAAWLVVVMVLFGAPLLAFARPLRQLKEATVLAASAVATRHERAVERKLLGSNMSAAGDAEAAAADEIPDAAKLYAAARKLSTFLIARAAIVPVGAAALLPLVAAGATQLPFRELLKIARGLLLL